MSSRQIDRLLEDPDKPKAVRKPKRKAEPTPQHPEAVAKEAMDKLDKLFNILSADEKTRQQRIEDMVKGLDTCVLFKLFL